MKNFKQIMLLVMTISVMSITSCSKDDDGDGGGGSTAEGTITATVDGQSFTTLEITSAANLATGGGQTTLTIQGNTASQFVNLIIFGYEGVGSYELSDNNVFISASYVVPNTSDPLNTQIWNAPYQDSGVVGDINISTDADGRVIGTFNFTGKNTEDGSLKTVTDGSFNLSKIEN
ncbi:MAG: DUF6252 family protein [Aquaticitalea sp.]